VPLTILIVDDDPEFAEGLLRQLGDEYRVRIVASGGAALELTNTAPFDLVLLDLMLPDMGGVTVLRRMRESGYDVPVVVMTAYGGVDSAVSAIRLGAADYIEKPFDAEKLSRTLRHSLERTCGKLETAVMRRIVGESPQIQAVWHSVRTFGATDLPILLQGETGTGKGMFALAIHEISKRSSGPFTVIDCAGLPESLFDSELFGYEKGAFTGASGSKPGRVQWADGGTLFLDEIGEIPLAVQAKLLRLVEDRIFTPLGARRPLRSPLNIRFVSATNHDLARSIEKNEFRRDLLFRLAGVTIRLPPLRERQGDVEQLIRYFVRKYRDVCRNPELDISPAALGILQSHSWPGNVREMDHVIGAAAAATETRILPEHLFFHYGRPDGAWPPTCGEEESRMRIEAALDVDLGGPINLKKVKEEIAHQAEMQVIAAARGARPRSKGDLAKFLGIDPKTLRHRERELEGRSQ